MSVKLVKLLHVLGNCLNHVQFYFWNKMNIVFGQNSHYSFIYIRLTSDMP
jgi:hypothetical protein